MGALARCVGDAESFLDRHWARSPYLQTGPAGSFESLASLADFDLIITSLGIRLANLRMVKDGKTLPPTAFTKGDGKRGRGPEAPADPVRVFELYEEGATIILEGLHRYWKPLAIFCRELELELGHRVQVNAYITPPGSQGFAVHSDEHDVLVLQIAGAKHWSVQSDSNPDEVLLEAKLEAGDCLYIPAGFPHSAATASGDSAHLTVGILTHDSADVLDEIFKMAGEAPHFAERLPLHPAAEPGQVEALVDAHIEDLRNWLDKADRAELAWRLTRRLTRSAGTTAAGQLEQLRKLDQLGPGSEARRRKGSVCILRADATGVRVLLADRELIMPETAAEPMSFVAGRSSFVVGELEAWLDPTSCVVLTRRLIREGLLEAVLDS